MKQTFFMLSLFIPGLTAPENDIDIYLQPLIDELNERLELKHMMLQQNKIFVCVQLYYGPLMIFLHMQIFLVKVLKGNFLVLFVIRIVCHIDYKTDGNGVTWVIVDFYQPIIDFDVIKGHLMEMRSIE